MDFKTHKISFKNKIHSVKINKTFKTHFKIINLDTIIFQYFKWDNQVIIIKITTIRENKEDSRSE